MHATSTPPRCCLILCGELRSHNSCLFFLLQHIILLSVCMCNSVTIMCPGRWPWRYTGIPLWLSCPTESHAILESPKRGGIKMVTNPCLLKVPKQGGSISRNQRSNITGRNQRGCITHGRDVSSLLYATPRHRTWTIHRWSAGPEHLPNPCPIYSIRSASQPSTRRRIHVRSHGRPAVCLADQLFAWQPTVCLANPLFALPTKCLPFLFALPSALHNICSTGVVV